MGLKKSKDKDEKSEKQTGNQKYRSKKSAYLSNAPQVIQRTTILIETLEKLVKELHTLESRALLLDFCPYADQAAVTLESAVNIQENLLREVENFTKTSLLTVTYPKEKNQSKWSSGAPPKKSENEEQERKRARDRRSQAKKEHKMWSKIFEFSNEIKTQVKAIEKFFADAEDLQTRIEALLGIVNEQCLSEEVETEINSIYNMMLALTAAIGELKKYFKKADLHKAIKKDTPTDAARNMPQDTEDRITAGANSGFPENQRENVAVVNTDSNVDRIPWIHFNPFTGESLPGPLYEPQSSHRISQGLQDNISHQHENAMTPSTETQQPILSQSFHKPQLTYVPQEQLQGDGGHYNPVTESCDNRGNPYTQASNQYPAIAPADHTWNAQEGCIWDQNGSLMSGTSDFASQNYNEPRGMSMYDQQGYSGESYPGQMLEMYTPEERRTETLPHNFNNHFDFPLSSHGYPQQWQGNAHLIGQEGSPQQLFDNVLHPHQQNVANGNQCEPTNLEHPSYFGPQSANPEFSSSSALTVWDTGKIKTSLQPFESLPQEDDTPGPSI